MTDRAATEEQVTAYAEAREVSCETARHLLSGASPELCNRLVKAAVSQAGAAMLHDPIEDEPHLRGAFSHAKAEAERIIRARNQREGMGYCHVLWDEEARILKTQFGIAWYSPADMNPDAMFD